MKRLAMAEKGTAVKPLTARNKIGHARLGRLPVVILPLEEYERMREDLEMLSSKKLPRQIEKSRLEARRGQNMTIAEAMRRLQLSDQ